MRIFLAIVLVVLLICALMFFQPGGFLVVDHPEKSDALVVLAGEQMDPRYLHALELLRAGYGNHLVVDVLAGSAFGHPITQLAQDFVAQTAGNNASQVSICSITGDSTKDEAPQAAQCLQHLRPPVRSVIVVTDDYHTRRALSIFRDRVPQYHWSAGAAHNRFLFGQPWWKNREWAKTYLTECQKLVWWELVDRWQK